MLIQPSNPTLCVQPRGITHVDTIGHSIGMPTEPPICRLTADYSQRPIWTSSFSLNPFQHINMKAKVQYFKN